MSVACVALNDPEIRLTDRFGSIGAVSTDSINRQRFLIVGNSISPRKLVDYNMQEASRYERMFRKRNVGIDLLSFKVSAIS